MPLQQEEITLTSEIQRLEQEREDIAEQAATLAEGNPKRPELVEEGIEIDTYLKGLRWATNEWGEETITLSGLTGGEFGKVEDTVVSAAAEQNTQPGGGATRVHLVASGTVNAPYIEDDMSEKQRVGAVSQLPITFLKWAEYKVDELTTVGGNGGTSFSDLLAAKQDE
jgi:hypothetical protein